jgi:membrane protease YdiL (CAAX protease family)
MLIMEESVKHGPSNRAGLALMIFLLAYNNLVNFLPSPLHARIYVVLNLTCLAGIWIMARRSLGLSPAEMGWSRRGLGKSLLWGIFFTALVIVPFLIALRILPRTGLNINPPRLEGFTPASLWPRILVRIPLGTVFFEEMLFRGIYYGHLQRRAGRSRALWISSLFFAGWHIVPAYEVVRENFRIGFNLTGVVYWTLGLAGAFCAGIFFAGIRRRTDNVAGCLLAHYLINSLVLLIIYFLWR